MTTSELLPCPFCGGKPKWTHHSNNFNGTKLVSASCCASVYGSPDEVADKWNTRIPAIAATQIGVQDPPHLLDTFGKPCSEWPACGCSRYCSIPF